ncbi:MAG TPA: UGSC family (seleno)protein, partial [Gammaproteobacteria bacterium]|nr:UGSC family (seleno)protein [Gammaproteobacteria bacterium]
HDAISSERVGTPALGVMTSKFVDAAELMARVLGMPDYKFAIIEHPVSSATDAELEARARVTLEAIEELVIVS